MLAHCASVERVHSPAAKPATSQRGSRDIARIRIQMAHAQAHLTHSSAHATTLRARKLCECVGASGVSEFVTPCARAMPLSSSRIVLLDGGLTASGELCL